MQLVSVDESLSKAVKWRLRMIDFIFQALAKMGYTHPAHPPITHLPVGLVAAAFIFAFVALLFRRTILPSLSY